MPYKVQGIISQDGSKDSYNTPKESWAEILQFIPKNTPLWVPFYNDGVAKKYIEELGFTDVYHENKDFFSYNLKDRLIIDNPPWSIKIKIIDRLYNENRPFSLSFPLDTLERKYILRYRKNFQLFIPDKRHSFESNYKFKGGKNATPPFKTCWFCWNMQKYLGNDKIIFGSDTIPLSFS